MNKASHKINKKPLHFINEKDTIKFYSKFSQQSDTPYTFDELIHKAEYQATKTIPRYSAHIGQLKLFLSEVQFLTANLKENTDTSIVIYVGSAPANKIQYLCELFPNIKFILIDPKEHTITGDALYISSNSTTSKQIKLYKDNQIIDTPNYRHIADRSTIANIGDIISNNLQYKYFIIEEEMTNNLATLLTIPHLFISDIRTVLGSDNDNAEPADLDILWNSAQNLNWISILKPQKFMLKFRCPYLINNVSINKLNEELTKYPNVRRDFEDCISYTGIDFIANFNAKKYIFIDYELLALQAFAPSHSTELRLTGSQITQREYDILDYEQKLFYYNIAYRSIGVTTCYCESKIGIDNCHDCALMMRIFAEYSYKYNLYVDIDDIVNRLLTNIDRNLLECGTLHGICRNTEINHKTMMKAYIARYINADDQTIKLISPVDGIRRLIVRQRINDDSLIRLMPLYDMFGYNTVVSSLKHIHHVEYNKLTQLMKHKYNERDIVEICRNNHISKNNIIKETYGVSLVFAKLIEEYTHEWSIKLNLPIVEISEYSQIRSRSRFIGIYENKLNKVLDNIKDELILAYIVGAEITLLFYIYELLKKYDKPTIFITDINDSIFNVSANIDGRLFVSHIGL